LTDNEIEKISKLTDYLMNRNDLSAEQRGRILSQRMKKWGKKSQSVEGMLNAVGVRWPVSGSASLAPLHVAISSNGAFTDNVIHVHDDLKAALRMDFDGDALQLMKMNMSHKGFSRIASNYEKRLSFYNEHFLGTTSANGFSRYNKVIDSLLNKAGEPLGLDMIEDLMQKSSNVIGGLTKFGLTVQAMARHTNAPEYTRRKLAGDPSLFNEIDFLETATDAIRQKGIESLKHKEIGGAVLQEFHDSLQMGGEKGFKKFSENLVNIEWIDSLGGEALDFKTDEGVARALELTMEALRKPFKGVFEMEDPVALYNRFAPTFANLQNFNTLDSPAAQQLVDHILTGSMAGISPEDLGKGLPALAKKLGIKSESLDMLAAINEGIVAGSRKGGLGKWVGLGVAAMGLMGMFTPEGVMDTPSEMNHSYGQQSAFDQTSGPSGPWSSPYDHNKEPAKGVGGATKISSKSMPTPTGPKAFPEASKHHRNLAMSPERAQPTQPNQAPATDNTTATRRTPLDSVTKQPNILSEREIVATQVNRFPKLRSRKVIDSEGDMRQIQKNTFSLIQASVNSHPMVNFSELHTVNHMVNDDRIIQDLIHSDLTEDNP